MEFEWWMIILPIALGIEIAKRIWSKWQYRGDGDSSRDDGSDSGWEFNFDFDSNGWDGD